MTADIIPVDEADRLAAVRRYDVLDTPPDGAFDRITALAARLLNTPISIVSVVDSDRIWFKSHHGVDVDQVGRDPGLCASAILQPQPWIVRDASLDPRTLANPLVTGDLGLRFYAGVPLTSHDGYNLGTLCVIDRQPRDVTAEQVATLSDLASLVVDELELRLSARRTVSLEAQLRQNAEDVARSLQESLLPPTLPSIAGLGLAARYHVANREQVGGDFYDVIATDTGCVAVIGDVCGKGTRSAALTGTARWSLRTIAGQDRAPSDTLGQLNEVLVRARDDPEHYVTLALAAIHTDAHGAHLTVALGGHPHPLVLHQGGLVEDIGVTSPIIGWRSGESFVDVTTRLQPGDALVMFTDGVTEALSDHGTTDDGALRRVLQPLAGRTAEQVAGALDAALGEDVTHDDAAFLVVRCQ